MQYGRGRPKRGSEVGPTPARSIRLPSSIWSALDEEARQTKTTVHALLRKAIVTYLEAQVLPRRR
jgi:predicted transcriptional regulator